MNRMIKAIPHGQIPPLYIPVLLEYGMGANGCNKEEEGFDDRFSVISVPILYLGARDGSDTIGDHTSCLMADNNLTYSLVLISGTAPAFDYGHADPPLNYLADMLTKEVSRQYSYDDLDIVT
jgi:hypothetical protein